MRKQIDWATQEGLLVIAGDGRRGTWAQSTLLRGSKTIRTGGQLSTCASAHTLLVVALTVALRDISNRDVSRLMEEKRGRRASKPRLVVRTTNESFASAVNEMIKGQDTKTLRAGKNFLSILEGQLSRFQITLELATLDDCVDVLTVAHWVGQHVHDPKRIESIPPSLSPSAVSVVV